MSTMDQVLGEFIDAWNAGRRPRVREYLQRVPEDERDELASQLSLWLETAGPPVYDEATRSSIRGEPIVARVFSTVGADEGAWAAVLPRLRSTAGLSLGDLASRLVARLGLRADEDTTARTAEFLEQMEEGTLGPDRVSRRVLDALGAIVGMAGATLAELGEATRLAPPGPARAAATFFRAEDDAARWVAEDIDVLSHAAMASAPAPMDELDRLFLGGPDAG